MTDGQEGDRKTFLVARNLAGARRTTTERVFDHPVGNHFQSESAKPIQKDYWHAQEGEH